MPTSSRSLSEKRSPSWGRSPWASSVILSHILRVTETDSPRVALPSRQNANGTSRWSLRPSALSCHWLPEPLDLTPPFSSARNFSWASAIACRSGILILLSVGSSGGLCSFRGLCLQDALPDVLHQIGPPPQQLRHCRASIDLRGAGDDVIAALALAGDDAEPDAHHRVLVGGEDADRPV